MSKVICGISNIPFTCEHVPMTLSHRELNHPIFYLSQRKLLGLASKYHKGELSNVDSYLLFLALLDSTDSVRWNVQAVCTSSTESIIASNIHELLAVIHATNAIRHPKFKQPKYVVTGATADLSNIQLWIRAWRANITEFKDRSASVDDMQALVVAEKKLSYLLLSAEELQGKPKLAAAVASWASKIGAFPRAKDEAWQRIIRQCYNLSAMFSTPKEELLELKEYCEENIEAGSIHFHCLLTTLRTGIANHNDFLGLPAFSTGTKGDFTLLSSDNSKKEAAVLAVIHSAPKDKPVRGDYDTLAKFIKASLAYRAAENYISSTPAPTTSTTPSI